MIMEANAVYRCYKHVIILYYLYDKYNDTSDTTSYRYNTNTRDPGDER